MFHLAALLAPFGLALTIATPLAQGAYDNRSAEDWAWQQIIEDKKADFGDECIRDVAKCGQISAKFLVDILTKKEVRDWIPRNRVRLRGARISGGEINRVIDLTNAEIAVEVWIDSSRIEGDLLLDGSHWSRLLDIQGSILNGEFSASRMRSDSDVRLRDNPEIKGNVDFFDAKVGGELILDGSLFAGALTGESLHVTGSLLMRHHAIFMGKVDLLGATIGGNISLRDATVWRMDLSGVGARELLLRGVGWWCGHPPATHWTLGASDWKTFQCDAVHPESLPMLILRNAHVDAFQDSADAWPPSLDLEGFRYERLGGLGGQGRDDMRRRSVEEWADWLRRDRTFSTQPYAELSSVLSAAGNRDTADEIRFDGRQRERSEVCTKCVGLDCLFGNCSWLTFLSLVAGYGIGIHTFRVLESVFVFVALGFVFLCFSPNACARSLWWRLGASLHRLLPIIKLSKEFDDFFDNPVVISESYRNLKRWQVAYFAVHAVVGWILGLILLAAMSGLTQKV
jgi:hypothetical protein